MIMSTIIMTRHKVKLGFTEEISKFREEYKFRISQNNTEGIIG